ncbi:MAG: hypothetical protein LBG06_00380 [Deltaproteobacteria bacterium]|nr:hypothetical protein [Deltaproteobacteria bacterium]
MLVELLAATGRRIPLQGIMIAIPAALLRPEREKELKDLGLETWSILNEVASELDFRPPIYLLVTLLDEDAGWAAVLERVERKGAPAGALVNYSDRRTVGGRVAAKRAADALEGEILGLLDEILEEEPGVIGPCLTAVAETESLRHPLEVFCEALSNPSPITPPHRIQGIFAARIPRYEGYREDASGDAAGDPLADPARAGRAAAPHHEVAPKGREWRPPSGDGGGQPAAADVHAGIPGSLPGAGGGLPGRPAVTLAATDVHAVIPGRPPGAGGGLPGRPAGPPAAGDVHAGLPGSLPEAPSGEGADPASSGPPVRGRAALPAASRSLSPVAVEGSLGMQKLLGRIIPEGGRLTEPLNLTWGPRQKAFLKALGLLYLILLALAVLTAMNVRYQRGASEYAGRSLLVYVPTDVRTFPHGSSLEKSDEARWLITRLDAYREAAMPRGIGPDRAGEYLKELEASFRTDFERAVEVLAAALEAQMGRSLAGPEPAAAPEPPRAAAGGLPPSRRGAGGREAGAGKGSTPRGDPELFGVTFRQLLWLYSAINGEVRSGESPQESFPILPQGFTGESGHYWRLRLASLLGYYLDMSKADPKSPPDKLSHLLAAAVVRATDGRSSAGLGWLTDWCAGLPEAREMNLQAFWSRYETGLDVSRLLSEGQPLEVSGAYSREGRHQILMALELIRQARKDAGLPRDAAADESAEKEYIQAYEKEYLDSWRAYKGSFESVARGILNAASTSDFTNQRNVGGVSPFTLTATILYDNLADFAGRDGAEPWLLNVALDQAVAAWGASKRSGSLRAVLTRPSLPGGRDGGHGSAKGGLINRASFVEKVYSAEASYARYMNMVQPILDDLSLGPDDALRLASRQFAGPGQALPAGTAGAPAAGGKGAGAAAPGGDGLASQLVQGAAQLLSRAGAGPRPAAAGGRGDSRYHDANEALDSFKALLYPEPGGGPPDDLFYNLRSGQLEAMKVLLVRGAAEAMDSKWQNEVVQPVRFMDWVEARNILYGPQGLIQRFVKTWASPFLEGSCDDTCHARSWEGRAFPFTDDFLKLAAVSAMEDTGAARGGSGVPGAAGAAGAAGQGGAPVAALGAGQGGAPVAALGAGQGGGAPGAAGGAGQAGVAGAAGAAGQAGVAGGGLGRKASPAGSADSFPVTVYITAAEVDADAIEKPLRTSLTVSTMGDVQTLDNYNYPVSKVFVWTPGLPATVDIEIQLPTLSLYINYDGPEGFPDFVSDVNSGGFLLTPADFPEHEDVLKGLGISRIDVGIRTDGAFHALNILRLSRTPLPVSIIKK